MPERFFLELESPETSSWPHVVVVGGGFAGLRVCRSLKGAKVRVTLIDKRNFNLFAPLLYQVATGLVSRGDVAIPLRMLVGDQANLQIPHPIAWPVPLANTVETRSAPVLHRPFIKGMHDGARCITLHEFRCASHHAGPGCQPADSRSSACSGVV